MPKDNSFLGLKLLLRSKLLAKLSEPRILDLFCGTGTIHDQIYRDHEYIGVDNQKIHDPSKCILEDNKRYIQNNDISEYNFIDLDDYGCPWKLLLLTSEKNLNDKLCIALTDGLPRKMKQTNYPGKINIVSALEDIPPSLEFHHLYYYYHDIFMCLLHEFSNRSGLEIKQIFQGWNEGKNVSYWGIYCEKFIAD